MTMKTTPTLCLKPSPTIPGLRGYTCELGARHRGSCVSRIGRLRAEWRGRGPLTIWHNGKGAARG